MRQTVTDLRDYAANSRTWAPRVILAEDDDRTRKPLAARFRRAGYELLEARDGVELLELISSEIVYPRGSDSIDLIVSDMHMPGATGLWVLASLRLLDWATPFVLMSGLVDTQMAAEAERLGVSAVLHKPFSPGQLLDLASELTGSAQPMAQVAGLC